MSDRSLRLRKLRPLLSGRLLAPLRNLEGVRFRLSRGRCLAGAKRHLVANRFEGRRWLGRLDSATSCHLKWILGILPTTDWATYRTRFKGV
jgi:hypothetical protein